MKPLSRCALADLAIDISWEQDGTVHRERYFADQFNCWRDITRGSPFEKVPDCFTGETFTAEVNPGELIPDYRADRVVRLPITRFADGGKPRRLLAGRFYPQGWISGIAGIFKGNTLPFRCVEVDGGFVTADLNHPMAGKSMTVEVTVLTRTLGKEERGGSCTDWWDLALAGPGMQARYRGAPTRFHSGTGFRRRDASSDTVFYGTDRFVHHMDSRARKNLAGIYESFLRQGDSVLDLMAGWESHLPEYLGLSRVHGIGLNANELRENPMLSGHTLQDVNADPVLPFSDRTFDAAICSLSVEYLIDPVAVFKEVARVVKSGGVFAVGFSNRWFPEKTIRVWEELHEFERMGLVLDFFNDAGRYDSLETVSIRGYPKPDDDPYQHQFIFSDPVYVVSGRVK